MAHFAELDENNIVIKIHHVHNDYISDEHGVCHDHLGLEHCCECMGHDNFVQCSINHNIRGRYPRIGDHYDPDLDAFIMDPPYDYYVLDTNNFVWVPPIPQPENTEEYTWDWIESLYLSDGNGWVKKPRISNEMAKRGYGMYYDENLKKYVVDNEPPPIQSMFPLPIEHTKTKEELITELDELGDEHSLKIFEKAGTEVIEDIEWDIILEYIYMNDIVIVF